ncbi:MAG TPA: hypothetical protein DD444_05190 [Citreicella sp.]|nr:hypothetical protein [Salipiger manganoxidans]HBM58565.1 hypothetical protein [Citreicella sp.]HBT02156.1 hypothetical protein [Citreicella sp.]
MMQELVQQSAGVGLGVFLGLLLGLGLRKRQGRSGGLLGGSVILTASAAGGVALIVTMALYAVTAG